MWAQIAYSPDGDFELGTQRFEARPTHWVTNVRLRQIRPKARLLLDLWDSQWDLVSRHWVISDVVRLTLRRYPGDQPPITVTLNCRSGGVTGPGLACDGLELPERLERGYRARAA
jgi:hypothetical protein